VATPIQFERGDKVRIAEGPYRGYEGLVETLDAGRMHVIVPVYGRPTRVELELRQVRPL
jgi:transcription termination/antitermination protein NusG